MKKLNSVTYNLVVVTIWSLFSFNCLRDTDAMSEDRETSSEELDEGPPHDPVTGNYALEPIHGFPPEPKQRVPVDNTWGSFSNFFSCRRQGKTMHPLQHIDIPDIIKRAGYSFESHKVHTEDGYILTMFRIPGSPNSPKKKGKIPVYLMHGLMGNALSWLFLPGNDSLAFKLANAGYDVYLGNARGTQYSIRHETLSSDSEEYWDFTFHEMGYYDIPAVIDYILNLTGHKSLYYIGHSMGTIQYTIAMSERPGYAHKIKVGFLLAPAPYFQYITNVVIKTTMDMAYNDNIMWRLFVGKKRINTKKLNQVTKNTCATDIFDCGACESVVYAMNGYNPSQNSASIKGFFAERYFDWTSTKVFLHLSQLYHNDWFAPFKYPKNAANLQKYGQADPPPYRIEDIVTPTVIFWGYSDIVIPPEDVKRTTLQFRNTTLVENNRVALKSFGHLDFLIAKDLQKYVTNRLLWIMDEGKYLLSGEESYQR